MCNAAVIEFFIENVRPEEFRDKRGLEVGGKYVNGSVRPLIERFMQPKEYIGADIEPGRHVDVVLSAEKLDEYFGSESLDLTILTETLEHVKDWRKVITNMKDVLKPPGAYITTRSRGFLYYGYPYDFSYDFWRYKAEDMRRIFADFEIINLSADWEAPGVFVKARKPKGYMPIDLSDIACCDE